MEGRARWNFLIDKVKTAAYRSGFNWPLPNIDSPRKLHHQAYDVFKYVSEDCTDPKLIGGKLLLRQTEEYFKEKSSAYRIFILQEIQKTTNTLANYLDWQLRFSHAEKHFLTSYHPTISPGWLILLYIMQHPCNAGSAVKSTAYWEEYLKLHETDSLVEEYQAELLLETECFDTVDSDLSC